MRSTLTTTRTWAIAGVLAATLAITALACSGGDSPTSPSAGGGATSGGGTTGGGGTSGTSSTTITIGADGRISPSTVTVSPGTRVTFVNSSGSQYDMSSNPHPEHTDCPEINQVGFITAGQTKQTGALTVAR